MTTITFRTDEALKKDLQEVAQSLWLSLNQLINLKMREFNQNRVLSLDLRNNAEVGQIEPIFWSEEFLDSEDYQRWAHLLSQI